jgi:hypothetical protein
MPASIRNKFANDRNGYICNFWRSVKWAPKEVAKWMDWPAVETDMHARHDWLCQQDLLPKLSANPEWFDATMAGWWAYGQVLFIGNAWCQNANQAGRCRLSSVSRGIIHKSARVGGTTCPWRNRSQGACLLSVNWFSSPATIRIPGL